MSTFTSTYDSASSNRAVRSDARALPGQVMGYVAATVARRLPQPGSQRRDGPRLLRRRVRGHSSGSTAPPPAVASRWRSGYLSGLRLLLGLAVAPVIADYAEADPSALWQAAGGTAAFVAALGAYGYATRRDLSAWVRPLFWALSA
jgi:modulator of FtsH protease